MSLRLHVELGADGLLASLPTLSLFRSYWGREHGGVWTHGDCAGAPHPLKPRLVLSLTVSRAVLIPASIWTLEIKTGYKDVLHVRPVSHAVGTQDRKGGEREKELMGHFKSRGGFLALYLLSTRPPYCISSFPLCGGVGPLGPPSTHFSVLLLLCWFLTCGLSLGLLCLSLLGGWGWLVSQPGDLSLLPSPLGHRIWLEEGAAGVHLKVTGLICKAVI